MPWQEAVMFTISTKIREILEKFSRSQSIEAYLVERSKIILMASENASNKKIAISLSMSKQTARKWRIRFAQGLDKLNQIEKESPKDLLQSIKIILMDEQRAGAPPTFTDEQVIRIIDLACKSPHDFGYEASHWSLNLLVKEIEKQGIAEKISAKSVSRFLKYGRNKTAFDSLLA